MQIILQFARISVQRLVIYWKNNQVNVEKQFAPMTELKPQVARRYRAETAIYKVEAFITFPSRPTDTSSTVQQHA